MVSYKNLELISNFLGGEYVSKNITISFNQASSASAGF